MICISNWCARLRGRRVLSLAVDGPSVSKEVKFTVCDTTIIIKTTFWDCQQTEDQLQGSYIYNHSENIECLSRYCTKCFFFSFLSDESH